MTRCDILDRGLTLNKHICIGIKQAIIYHISFAPGLYVIVHDSNKVSTAVTVVI